ncbi:MAG: glycosyltransferase N-terminal domain-containing protein [Gemmatimonadota bacterium]
METVEGIYTIGLRFARGLLPLLSRGEGKLARGIRGRRSAPDRLVAWAERERDPVRPLVWFHAPSVGEGLQAGAVMDALLERRPDAQIVYTYFSPSAERLASRLPAAVAGYLPIDLPDTLRPVFDALDPSVIAFSRTEVWPNLTRIAADRGVPTLLLNATLPARSSRLREPTRSLLAPAHRRLLRVGAISEADAQRFRRLDVPPERLLVMGDARFDQVARRAAAADRGGNLLRSLAGERPTVVAGSTWPEDEEPLSAAFASLPGASSRYRMILVPHEPVEAHLLGLERTLDRIGHEHVRLGRRRPDVGDPPVIIVDRVGILGDLYALADVAYVGGGFGTAGLHSVLEPAAFGVPVLFGPRHSGAREAAEMVECGAAYAVADQVDLGRTLARLLTNAEPRLEAGAAAARYIAAGLGAADRGAGLIMEALGGDG